VTSLTLGVISVEVSRLRLGIMSVGLAIVVGAVIGLVIGILVAVITDVPLAPEIGLVLGGLAGWRLGSNSA
jgi:hypothetical protein